MIRAIALARRCESEPGRVSPKVGAVLVHDGMVLGEAFRGECAPGDHAEFTLLEKKLGNETVAGATLFTTLEPCTARNPPKLACAERIAPSWDVATDEGPDGRSSRSGAAGPERPSHWYTADGDKVEWIPDHETPGEAWPLLLRRNDGRLLEAYNELWDKVWWNRHQNWRHRIESGQEPLTDEQEAIFRQASEAAAAIEAWPREPRVGRLRVGSAERTAIGAVLGPRRRMERVATRSALRALAQGRSVLLAAARRPSRLSRRCASFR